MNELLEEDVRYAKKRWIVSFILLGLIFVVSLITMFFLREKNKEPRIIVIEKEIVDESTSDEVLPAKDISKERNITGADVIAAYKEVEGTDFAFLIATQALLEADLFDLMDLPEYYYLVYVISANESNIVDTLNSKNGLQVNLLFVNYNRVINDTCLLKKANGYYFETSAGFREEESDPTIQTFFEMNELNNPFKINKKANFIAREIYNSNGEVIGCTYIEQ